MNMYESLAQFTLSFGLLLTCVLWFGLFLIACIYFLLLISCLIDAFNKDPEEFPDRNLWILILIGTQIFGFGWIAVIVYYILYKPKILVL